MGFFSDLEKTLNDKLDYLNDLVDRGREASGGWGTVVDNFVDTIQSSPNYKQSKDWADEQAGKADELLERLAARINSYLDSKYYTAPTSENDNPDLAPDIAEDAWDLFSEKEDFSFTNNFANSFTLTKDEVKQYLETKPDVLITTVESYLYLPEDASPTVEERIAVLAEAGIVVIPTGTGKYVWHIVG